MLRMYGPHSSVDNIGTPEESIILLEPGVQTYEICKPDSIDTPLVFASPHSGRGYPTDFLKNISASMMDLRRIEDAFVDLLVQDMVSLGAPVLLSKVGRACVDLNRASSEIDVSMFDGPLGKLDVSRSPRVSAGLGCLPRIAFAGRPIYQDKLEAFVAAERLQRYYHPYHNAMDRLLDAARLQFGTCMLIDCHSMPSAMDGGGPLPDFVLGDRFGAACSPALTRTMEYALKKCGYTVARNAPYAGGYITQSRGRPAKRRHALQIEINRRLYLNEDKVVLKPGFNTLKENLMRCFVEVSHWASDFAGTYR